MFHNKKAASGSIRVILFRKESIYSELSFIHWFGIECQTINITISFPFHTLCQEIFIPGAGRSGHFGNLSMLRVIYNSKLYYIRLRIVRNPFIEEIRLCFKAPSQICIVETIVFNLYSILIVFRRWQRHQINITVTGCYASRLIRGLHTWIIQICLIYFFRSHQLEPSFEFSKKLPSPFIKYSLVKVGLIQSGSKFSSSGPVTYLIYTLVC